MRDLGLRRLPRLCVMPWMESPVSSEPSCVARNILIGIAGAIVGGWIMRAVGFNGHGGTLYTILVAIGGAIRIPTHAPTTRPMRGAPDLMEQIRLSLAQIESKEAQCQASEEASTPNPNGCQKDTPKGARLTGSTWRHQRG
jgi:hypothetical protein